MEKGQPFSKININMRETIKKQLNQALSNNSLDVLYQIQNTHINNKFIITGVEALCRLSSENGPVSPDLFISVAEDSNQIVELGSYVLNSACKQLRKWLDDGIVDDTFTMSVNVSAKQLDNRHCITDMLNIIKLYNIPYEQICLEITESSFIEDINLAILHRLAHNGIKISIDDFGTGLSSLARLKFLPLKEIKIDKLFINDITHSTSDIAMMTALHQLSNALSLSCIVEGIETNEQLFILIGIGFTNFQGYFFSEPGTSEETTKLIKLTNF